MYKTYKCIVCDSESRWRHSKTNQFCSIKCQQHKKYSDYINEWKFNDGKSGNKYGVSVYIKRYIREKYQNVCCECGITDTYNNKPIVLEVDHIDGNPYNNNENNLRLICPNCHSQSSNYKNKNMGNGRKYRKDYYEFKP